MFDPSARVGTRILVLLAIAWVIGKAAGEPYISWWVGGLGVLLVAAKVAIVAYERDMVAITAKAVLGLALTALMVAGVVTASAGVSAAAGPTMGLRAGLGFAGVGLAALVVRWVRRKLDWYRYLPHRNQWVIPAHEAVAAKVGTTDWAPEEYLRIPEGFADVAIDDDPEMSRREKGITLALPPGPIPNEAKKTEIVGDLVTKLGLTHHGFEWRLDGQNRHLHLWATPPPASVPRHVPFDDDFKRLLEEAPADRWLVGRTVDGEPYYLDPSQDNPHILLSCLTGWGKSNAIGLIVADHLHKGGEVLVLDFKYGSMPWAADLPGVTYARSAREIHDALIRVGMESTRRREELQRAPWDKRPKFPRMLIVVEETNSTVDELNAFWVEERARLKAEAKALGETIDLPTKSPALKAYRQAGFMGRELCMNLLVISQRAEANAVGGSAIRDQLGTKILGWPSIPDWNMHAKSHAFRQSNGRPGHSFIVRVNTVDEVQWAYGPPRTVREWALSGRPALTSLPFLASHRAEVSDHGDVTGAELLGTDGQVGSPQDPDDAPITLRDAVDQHVVDMPLTSLQRYSRPSMTVGFPPSVGQDTRSAKLYDREALRSWGQMWKSNTTEPVED